MGAGDEGNDVDGGANWGYTVKIGMMETGNFAK